MKNSSSILWQTLNLYPTGASGLIYALRTTSPGSHHDAHVFQDSRLYYKLAVEGWRPFYGAMMAADSAYRVSTIGQSQKFFKKHC